MYDSFAKMTAMGSKPRAKKSEPDEKDWRDSPSSQRFGRLMREAANTAKYDTRMMLNPERKAQAMPVEAKKDKAAARRNALSKARANVGKKKLKVFSTKNIPVSPTK